MAAPRVLHVQISKIKVGKRFRREMGDLEGLANSIRERGGLLQPVAITERLELVCGERRLRACKLLGLTHVPAFVVAPDDALLGEYDENHFHQPLALSERVLIAEAVRRRLGSRQGQKRPAGGPGATPADSSPPEPPAVFLCVCGEPFDAAVWHCLSCGFHGGPRAQRCPNCKGERGESPAARKIDLDGEEPPRVARPEVEPESGERVRDFAARTAGFSSPMEFRRAAQVLKDGDPQLVTAMDRHEVTVYHAAELATLPKARQREVLAQGPEAVVAVAKKIKAGGEASYTPHSDRLAKLVKDAKAVIEHVKEEEGGVGPMLADRVAWDWKDVYALILPGLEEVARACQEYAKAIRGVRGR